MGDSFISEIKAREILDSKGRPIVEVDVWSDDGFLGRGSSPCGTSVGKNEAFVLRDGGKRYGGLGVQKAVHNVLEVISPALIGKSVYDQRTVDHLMIDLDGTQYKSRFGANAIFSVSIAVARVAARSLGLPLYRYLARNEVRILPRPIFNMINGGPYSSANVAFQEFLLMPTRAKTFADALRMSVEVFFQLGVTIERRYGKESVRCGHMAGFSAPTENPSELIKILLESSDQAGYGGQFEVGLDCAASHFYDKEHSCYEFMGKKVGRNELIEFLEELIKPYPVFMIEDPLDEDDFEGHAEVTRRFKLLVAGDDLFTTNVGRLKKGLETGAANAMVLKPNMVGTLTEALDAARFAQEHNYWIIPSCRSGVNPDDPIPDIAVAVEALLMKVGAPQTGERIAIQNRLLRIEEELGESAQFPPLGKNLIQDRMKKSSIPSS
jgi:enolase